MKLSGHIALQHPSPEAGDVGDCYGRQPCDGNGRNQEYPPACRSLRPGELASVILDAAASCGRKPAGTLPPPHFDVGPSTDPRHIYAMLAAASSINSSGCEQRDGLREVQTQMGMLMKMTALQAEQMNAMNRQLHEQSEYMMSTMQTCRQLQSQMNSFRDELKDVYSGQEMPVFRKDRLGRPASQLESRRGDCAAPPGLAKTEAEAGGCTAATADKPAGAPSAEYAVPDTSQELAAKGSTNSSVPPEEHGFNRSPPGLSLWDAPDEQRPGAQKVKEALPLEQTLSDMLVFGDVGGCLDALQRSKAEDLNKVDADGMTILHHAAMLGHAGLCVEILNHPLFDSAKAGDRNTNTALHIAVLHDQAGVCRALVSHDTSIAMSKNSFGETALQVANRRGDPTVCDGLKSVPEPVVS